MRELMTNKNKLLVIEESIIDLIVYFIETWKKTAQTKLFSSNNLKDKNIHIHHIDSKNAIN